MTLSDTDFTLETREAFERVLEKDEDILWYGRPDGKLPKAPLFFASVFGLMWVIIPGVMIYMMFQSAEQSVDRSALAFLSLSVLIGPLVSLGIITSHKRQSQASYLLTNKRAIVCAPKLFKGAKMYLYPVCSDMILEVKKNKDGSGNIVLGQSDVAVNNKPLPLGFLYVKDMSKPLSVLKELGADVGAMTIDA